LAGDILAWGYESIRLKLTDAVVVDGKRRAATWYKPDFAVWLPDGRLRCVEVKGYRREAALVRFKLARDKYRQIEFIMVRRVRGAWEVIL
jgi:hypothetical protein